MGFDLPMEGNSKETVDDAGNCEFDFIIICESNKAILYSLGVEVVWGNFLIEFMGCSVIKSRGIHDGMVMSAVKLADEFLDIFKRWCIWGKSIVR